MRDSILSVLRENASEIQKAESALASVKTAQICELSEVGKEHTDPTQLFRAVFGDNLVSTEYAQFCRALLGGKKDSTLVTALLPEFTPLGEQYEEGEAAYPLNPYTDAAFQQFIAGAVHLSAQHQPSFSAACEEVYHGRCRYCILPLQNTEDGVLASFAGLIAKYELNIFRICDVFAGDGNSLIRFALLRRGVVPYVPVDGYFQTQLTLPPQTTVGAFLNATDALGAHTEHLHTVPLAFASGLTSLTVTFRIGADSLAPLLLFLRTALDGYTAGGIYEKVHQP